MTARLTKIVATLGPASRNEPTMRHFLETGVNVFRFNYSHAEYDELEKAYKLARRLSKELDKPVGLLSDLQGPKFRVGRFEDGEFIMLEKGQRISFAYGEGEARGDKNTIRCNVQPLVRALEVGNSLLLDDGTIELKVVERRTPDEVVCEVQNAGKLKERKGINVPDIAIPVPALTDKDKSDCEFALKQGTDFVALSFVQHAKDVIELREYMASLGYAREDMPQIVCKIEKPQAIDNIDEILAETDVIMVARGDLGVELRPEYVPSRQKRLIQRANELQVPVITATHMLESMISKPFPTRAEVSDVANAVYDGTDAVMLSGESAMGDYPKEAVSMMHRIAVEAESHVDEFSQLSTRQGDLPEELPLSFHQTIANSAVDVSLQADVKAIIVVSYSGKMAKRISKNKPNVPILAITPCQAVYNTLNVCYGIRPILIEELATHAHPFVCIDATLQKNGYIEEGESVVLCAGETNLVGLKNSIQLYHVGEVAHRSELTEGALCTLG